MKARAAFLVTPTKSWHDRPDQSNPHISSSIGASHVQFFRTDRRRDKYCFEARDWA